MVRRPTPPVAERQIRLRSGESSCLGLAVEVESIEEVAGLLVRLLDRVVVPAAGRVVDPVLGVVHRVEAA